MIHYRLSSRYLPFIFSVIAYKLLVTGWTYHCFQQKVTCSISTAYASSRFEDEISSVAAGLKQNDDILKAAAAVTQDQCQLIGVKSLGVDYGLARTGIAFTSGFSPEPLYIIDETNGTLVANQVAQYASSLQVSQIVLGLPVHKNGTEAEQTNNTRIFGDQLASFVLAKLGPDVPVLYWDERYTSKEATARLRSKNPNQQFYGTIDAEAACIILESFYRDNGKEAERIEVNSERYAASLTIYEQMKLNEEQRKEEMLEKRQSNFENRKNAVQRAKKLEEEMKAKGILGESNKKKRKRKKKKKKKFNDFRIEL